MAVRELQVVIRAKDLYKKVMTQAQQLATETGRAFHKIGALAKKGAVIATAAFVGLVVGIAAVTRESRRMNEELANVATLIPGQVKRLDDLKGAVQSLAVETGKATDDITQGLFQVISIFGDSAETAGNLAIATKAAVAGVATTTEAVDLLALVTKGYGDTSTEALQKVSDLSFMTVKLGKTDFPALAASMGKVIPIAEKMSVSQEELFASFATLTGVTGDTKRVSTQMTGVLGAMLKPTKDMSKAVADLGFAGSESMLQSLGLMGSLKALIGTTDGSTESVGKLFANLESLPAVFALTGSQSDTFEEKLDALTNASGATEAAFLEQTEGVNEYGFRVNQAKQAVIVLAQSLGDVITKNKFVVGAIKLATEQFQKMNKWVKENNVWLMNLVKRGFVALLTGVSAAIEVIRLFSNTWSSLKLIGSAVVFGLVDAVRAMVGMTNASLDAWMSKIVSVAARLGIEISNPFEGAIEKMENFKFITTDVMSNVIDETVKTDLKFQGWGATVDNLKGKLIDMSVAAVIAKDSLPDADDAASIKTGGEILGPLEPPKAKKEKATFFAADLARLRADTPFDDDVDESGLTEVERLTLRHEEKMIAQQDFLAQELLIMGQGGAQKEALLQTFHDRSMQMAETEAKFKTNVEKIQAKNTIATATSLLTFFGQHSKKATKALKVVSVTNAVIAGKTAAVSAWEKGMTAGGLPIAALYTAVSLAKTGSLIASIGGGGGGGGEGGGGVSPGGISPEIPQQLGAEPELATQSIIVNVHNPLSEGNWDAIGEDIVGSINKAGERNVELTIKSTEPTLA